MTRLNHYRLCPKSFGEANQKHKMFHMRKKKKPTKCKKDTCICMAESLCCPPETIKTLLIGYTPTQNTKFN